MAMKSTGGKGLLFRVLGLCLSAAIVLGAVAVIGVTPARAASGRTLTVVVNKSLRHNTTSPRDRTFTFQLRGRKSGVPAFTTDIVVEVTRASLYWYGSAQLGGLDPDMTYTLTERTASNYMNGRYNTTISKEATYPSTTEEVITFTVVNTPDTPRHRDYDYYYDDDDEYYEDYRHYDDTYAEYYYDDDYYSYRYDGYYGRDTNSGTVGWLPGSSSVSDASASASSSSSVSSSSAVTSTGETNQAALTVLMEKAAATASGTEAVVRVQNAASVTGATLRSLHYAADKHGKTAMLHANTTGSDGALQGRLDVDASALTGLRGSIQLKVRTQGSRVDSIKSSFDEWYTNTVAVVSMDHKGSLGGARLQVAAKADLTGLHTNALRVYVYDSATGALTLLNNPRASVDANGFLHLYTDVGGDLIVTDAALNRR